MRIVMMAVEVYGEDTDYQSYIEELKAANDPHITGNITVLDREYDTSEDNEDGEQNEIAADAAFQVADGLVRHFADMPEEEIQNRE